MVLRSRGRLDFEELIAQAGESDRAPVSFRTNPVYGLVTRPTAAACADLDARVALLSRWIVRDPTSFASDEGREALDAILRLEGLTRQTGGYARATLTFTLGSAPNADVIIPSGLLVFGTSRGRVVYYATTDRVVIRASNIEAYRDAQGKYSVNANARALVPGPDAQVGPRVLTGLQSSFLAVESVTNERPSSRAQAEETDAEVLERLSLAIRGRSVASVAGIELSVLTAFPSVTHVASRRVGSEVEVFVFGGQEREVREVFGFLGIGNRHVLQVQPVVQVEEASVVGGGPLVEAPAAGASAVGQYDFALEGARAETRVGATAADGRSGSMFGRAGLSFFPNGPGGVQAGDNVLVTYVVDQTVRDVQRLFDQPTYHVPGGVLRVRRGTLVDFRIGMLLVFFPGSGTSEQVDACREAILDHFRGLTPGAPVQTSDVETAVRVRVPQLDKVQTQDLARLGGPRATSDVELGPFELAVIDSGDVTFTVQVGS